MKSLVKSSYAVREPIKEEVAEALVQNTNTEDETLKISFIRNKLLGGLLIVAGEQSVDYQSEKYSRCLSRDVLKKLIRDIKLRDV